MTTDELERHLAHRLGARHAVAFGYARHALISILVAAGLRPGDEVVLSPLTCKVVPLALLSLDLKPVYADISAETLNLDPSRVADAITPATRAVLFQHTYGNPAGVASIARCASANGLLLVEDCAQCMPTLSDGYTPGRSGHAAIFSNNLLKPLPAGSGGVAVTDDAALTDRIRALRDRSPERSNTGNAMLRVESWLHRYLLRSWLYWPLFEMSRRFASTYRAQPTAREISDEITRKEVRVSAFQVREGAHWLARVDDLAAHRRACCDDYVASLRELAAIEMPCRDVALPLYYFPVLVRGKDDLLRAARRRCIELVPWPIRTPIYPVEDERRLLAYGYRPGSCAIAETVAHRLVGLPTGPAIGQRQRARVTTLLTTHHAALSEAHPARVHSR